MKCGRTVFGERSGRDLRGWGRLAARQPALRDWEHVHFHCLFDDSDFTGMSLQAARPRNWRSLAMSIRITAALGSNGLPGAGPASETLAGKQHRDQKHHGNNGQWRTQLQENTHSQPQFLQSGVQAARLFAFNSFAESSRGRWVISPRMVCRIQPLLPGMLA